MGGWEFIPTEFLGGDGEAGERLIWEKVVQAFQGTGEGIGFLNYTDFVREHNIRYQPDILLVSRQEGLTVIEVKTCSIHNIVNIRANQWEMHDFYDKYIYPFRQGEKQLRQLLKRCDRRPSLQKRIPGRVIVALPCISREEWRAKGFDDEHPTCPPIIFGDELSRRSLRDAIEYRTITLQPGDNPLTLNDQDWSILQRALSSGSSKESTLTTVKKSPSAPMPQRTEVLTSLQSFVFDFDLQQAKIGMQIPPGPQRIRGIAGSGKTLLLCQKAARMHLQHPDWEIALVFFTRSLYQLVPEMLRHWLEYWSDGEIQPDFVHGKLKVLHAWGSQNKAGFYSLLRDQYGGSALVTEKVVGNPSELLASACSRLLETTSIEPIFDAILIDEGQDLVTNDEWKLEDKQAIYWLAWQALRPVHASTPEQRRLIWTYDEAQSLDSLKIPTYGEIFGQELGALLSGQNTGPAYKGGIQKSEVMKRCYRTPGPILLAAHALGMGLLRQVGMLSGYTNKEDWEAIGYEVTQGNFRSHRETITLHRPSAHSPNPVPHLWGASPLEFEVYSDWKSQLHALATKIQYNIEVEGLRPSRDLLVIVLGSDLEGQTSSTDMSSKHLQRQVASTLQAHGLNYYLPGATAKNQSPLSNNQKADTFWCDDALTVARIHRAKGHEAKMVYIVGLEFVAQAESNLLLRNQLFVALTRSMAWVHLSGIKDPHTHAEYLLYDEVRAVMKSETSLTFTYRKATRPSLKDKQSIPV